MFVAASSVDLAKCKLCVYSLNTYASCDIAINSVAPIEFENVHPLVNQHKKKREKVQQNISWGHSEWPLTNKKNNQCSQRKNILIQSLCGKSLDILAKKTSRCKFVKQLVLSSDDSFSPFWTPKKKVRFSSGQKNRPIRTVTIGKWVLYIPVGITHLENP